MQFLIFFFKLLSSLRVNNAKKNIKNIFFQARKVIILLFLIIRPPSYIYIPGQSKPFLSTPDNDGPNIIVI